MASAPQTKTADPIAISGRHGGTERWSFSPQGGTPLNFGTEDEPILIASPVGVGELVLQNRRCGDWYAEVSGPKGCRSAIGASPLEAYERVAEQVA